MAKPMETQFFGKLRQVRPPHIREVPKFDLDTYIANYKGARLPFPSPPTTKNSQARHDSTDYTLSAPLPSLLLPKLSSLPL